MLETGQLSATATGNVLCGCNTSDLRVPSLHKKEDGPNQVWTNAGLLLGTVLAGLVWRFKCAGSIKHHYLYCVVVTFTG